jgi:hypothetical protein
MTDRDEAARALILARLAESRAELRRLIVPPPRDPDGSSGPFEQQLGGFPRSRTMQMLLSGRGMGVVGAVAAGLFIARPALALRLLRMLPAGTVARMLLPRVLDMLRTKPADRTPQADRTTQADRTP